MINDESRVEESFYFFAKLVFIWQLETPLYNSILREFKTYFNYKIALKKPFVNQQKAFLVRYTEGSL
jgi:hypothetical protein